MKKIFKILVIIVIVFCVFFLFKNKLVFEYNPLMELNSFLTVPVNKISNEINDLRTFKSIDKLNKKLEKENILLRNELEKSNELKNEIDSLKKLIKLEKTYVDYKYIYSRIISRNSLYWYDTFVIDNGSSSDIKIGDPVLSKNGFVGRVVSISKNFSTVRMLTSNYDDNKISVSVGSSLANGVITSYKNDYLVIEGTTNYDKVSIGDSVYTSGYGNLPKGLLIGNVKNIKEDRYGISNILYVQLSSNFDDIDYVMVLSND